MIPSELFIPTCNILSVIFLLLSAFFHYRRASSTLFISDPYYIYITAFAFYSVAGQSYRIPLDDYGYDVYSQMSLLVCLSSLIFLLISPSIPARPPNISIFYNPIVGSRFLIASILSFPIGYAFFYLNYSRIGGVLSVFSNSFNRIDRNEQLRDLSGNLPYTHFIYIAQILLLAALLLYGYTIIKSLLLSAIPASPVLLFFLIEGDRTSIIRHILAPLFVVILFRLNGKIKITLRLLITIILSFMLFAFIGNIRSAFTTSLATGSFHYIPAQIERRTLAGMFLPTEFPAVHFTANKVLSDYQLKQIKPSFGSTYLQGLSYPFPRTVHRFFGNTKQPTLSDEIGESVAYEIGRTRALGFGMSPVAESISNFGYIGPLLLPFAITLGYLVWRLMSYSPNNIPMRFLAALISPVFLFGLRTSFASMSAFVLQLTFIFIVIYATSIIIHSLAFSAFSRRSY